MPFTPPDIMLPDLRADLAAPRPDAARPDAPESCLACLIAILFGHEMPLHPGPGPADDPRKSP